MRAVAAKSDLCEKLGCDLHEALSQLSKAEKLVAQLKLELEQETARLKSLEASQASVVSSELIYPVIDVIPHSLGVTA